jgi:NDP-sugar pyrophosphorylase family protein
MLPVAGRPFAHWQLCWLAEEGVSRVLFSVGYLGGVLEDFVGDGGAWDLDVAYVREEERLLGTAGAIRLAADSGLLESEFFVLYGDSYLSLDLASVERAFRSTGQLALMTVLRNEDRWDRSNVVYADGRVLLYDKYRTIPRKDMRHIDYGLSVLTRDYIESHVRPGETADLSPLLRDLSKAGGVAGYEATERFYEVGSPQGLKDLEAFLRSGRP